MGGVDRCVDLRPAARSSAREGRVGARPSDLGGDVDVVGVDRVGDFSELVIAEVES